MSRTVPTLDDGPERGHNDIDAIVVGAGPAGAAAAIEIGRAGGQVCVIDRAHFPRDKTCGDGLTTLALRQLEALDVDPGDVASWEAVHQIHLRTPGGRVIDLELPDTGLYSAVASRLDLDHALVTAAGNAGADVRLGSAVVSVDSQPAGITVGLDDGSTLSGRWLIAADGMWSPTRRLLGLDAKGYRGELHALRRYGQATGPLSRDQWVWFDDDLIPGYAWSFPLADGRVNIGIAVQRTGRLDGGWLKTTMAGLHERPHIAEVLGEVTDLTPVKAWPIPAGIIDIDLTAGPVMFVGDAARATDPLTGEGIAQALLTGRLAGRSVVEAISTAGGNGDAAAAYETAALDELAADHRMAVRCIRALDGRRRAEIGLRLAGSTRWTRAHVARWMFEDEPRAIAVTPKRWHRQLFRRPGAYVAGTTMPAVPE